MKDLKTIFKMAIIDLKKTYRGSVLGYFWFLAKPSMQIFMYWFVFAIGMRASTNVNGFPYFVWLVVGMLPWFYIAENISISPNVFKKYSYLVNKIKFPIHLIPTFMNLSKLIVNLALSVIVIIIYLFNGGVIDIYFIQLPIIILLMFVFLKHFNLILATLGTLSKDFGNLIKTFLTPLMMLSPILWDINKLNIPWLKAIQMFNPINFIVSSYRKVFIYKEWIFTDWLGLLIFIVEIIIVYFVSKKLFEKTRKEIPDFL